MTEFDARSKAQEAHGQLGLSPEYKIAALQRRLIELPEGFAEQPTRVRDALVWIARFENESAWIEVAIEDANGQVVRVERSRGFVMAEENQACQFK
ncbi:MAG TPA: hypothetical protein VFZ34_30450 [Blastocatellia bacterium]|nr:hypothetical protein [Blastocatellia bacterium]